MSKKLPKHVRKTVQRIALVGVVLFTLAMILRSIDWRMGSVIAQDVHINVKPINGYRFLSEEDVLKLIADRTNHNFVNDALAVGQLNLRTIEDSLKQSAFVDNAEAYIDARNQLYIDITQREPIVKVLSDQGNYYLDREGRKLPSSPRDVARVLVATGNIPDYTPGFEVDILNPLSVLHHVATYIHDDEFLKPLIEQIYVEKQGDLVLVPKLGQHTIVLGNDERLEEKFRYLKIFYNEILPQKGWNAYKRVSLAFEGQVVGIK